MHVAIPIDLHLPISILSELCPQFFSSRSKIIYLHVTYLYLSVHLSIYGLAYSSMYVSIALSTNASISLESTHIWHICQYSRLFKCFVSVNQSINSSLYNPPIRSIAGSRGLVNELRESPWSVGLRSCASKGFFISTAWDQRIENHNPNSFGKNASSGKSLRNQDPDSCFFSQGGLFFGGWGNHCPLESDDATRHIMWISQDVIRIKFWAAGNISMFRSSIVEVFILI